jgi:hypothetical protein
LASGEYEDDIRRDPQLATADGVMRRKIPMTPEELKVFLKPLEK